LRTASVLVLSFLTLGCTAFFLTNPALSVTVQGKPGQRVTLLNRKKTAKDDNWKKATVSFLPRPIFSATRNSGNQPFQATANDWSLLYLGVNEGGDQASPARPVFAPLNTESNDWDLLYGSLSLNGDRDWLMVNSHGKGWSRIRDLGEMDWSDNIAVPILPTLPCSKDRPCGHIHIPPPKAGMSIADQDLNPHIAKPIAGHMYVIRRNMERQPADLLQLKVISDYYILLRVEELKPNESCTITWKRVSTPKK
jgi:hypothetical protein